MIGRTANLTKIEFQLSLGKSLAQRIDNSFINTYKPVMDDAPYRIFDSLRDYRKWCREKLPKWLGYGR
jgi:hypothetical protein